MVIIDLVTLCLITEMISCICTNHSNTDWKGAVYIYDCNGTATIGLGSEKVNLICKLKIMIHQMMTNLLVLVLVYQEMEIM